MTDSRSESTGGTARTARDVFAAWLDRDGETTQDALDELCARHADVADELRALFAAHRMLAEAATRAGGEERDDATLLLVSRLLLGDGSTADRLPDPTDAEVVAADMLRQLIVDRPRSPRYTDRERVGRGGMGIVLKAWDPRLQRHLAKKVLKSPKGPPIDEREQIQKLARFLEEAQVTSQLHHPSIVPVHDLGIDERGRIYYTMPLIRGKTLDAIFRLHAEGDADWPLARVLGLFVRVGEAIAFAHSRGVVHRDLKPSNVMVGPFGETYVMDWGLALVRDPDASSARQFSAIRSDRHDATQEQPSPVGTWSDQVLGTPCYMAPEQATGDRADVGPWSDIHSLGAMLYHLLAGGPPYSTEVPGADPRAVVDAIRRGPPRPLAEVAPAAPRQLAAIAEKAMAQDPGARYRDARAFARDLEAFLGHRPTEAAQPGGFDLLKLAVRRNLRVCIVGAVAAVLLLASLLSFILYQQRQAVRRERMLDFNSAQALRDQAEDVYPIDADGVARMGLWLRRASALLAKQPRYEREADEQLETPPPSGKERDAMLANMGAVRGTIPRIERHLQIARDLALPMAPHDAEMWRKARADIAARPDHGHLDLPVQHGLVPLRKDPESELWEFWLVASGARPGFDPNVAGYELDAESGLVLVLVPGAVARIGSSDNPFARAGGVNELPTTVRLDPYFIGKHEVCQAVWHRVMFQNPSRFHAGRKWITRPGLTYSWLLPVEQVSWPDCNRFVHRLGVELPTEVQWEHAARAGSDLWFGRGNDPRSLDGYENVKDLAYEPAGGDGIAPWRDGFGEETAPIASFLPNPWGLHDVLGNVSEWCRDPYQLEPEFRPGDGIQEDVSRLVNDVRPPGGVPVDILPDRSTRGGSWFMEIRHCRPSFRNQRPPGATQDTFGLRVARRVDA